MSSGSERINMDFAQEALKEAQKSPCKKRQVGAVIISAGKIIGRGHNHNPEPRNAGDCEDNHGKTFSYVVHAEMAALQSIGKEGVFGAHMYVTHQPCTECLASMKDLRYTVVKSFMKFDNGKLRYSLIPPIALKAIASVLTYGAKKYKPNNWKEVDSVDRYWDALYRHLEANRSGEILDEESKLPHLWHAITNICFIIYLS